MADSSSLKTSSLEITPKEEPATLDKPKSPNPFLPADHVEFIFEEITFTTNNEVALLYPSHPNSEYFREVSDFVSKWGIRGDIDVPMDPKAPKPSSQTEEVPQGKKPKVKSRLSRKQSSKHTSESKTGAFKSKTGQSEKETQSNSAKDKSPSHPSPPTPVVSEMHKEAQQASSGLKSLGATSEEGAHPQLSRYNASADSTVEVDPGLSAPNDSIPSQQDQTKSARDGLKTAQTDSDESEEEEVAKDKDIHASSHDVPEDTSTPNPPSPKLAQIQELMAQPELSKLLASHNIASCLLTKLKKLPLKFTELSREIKELKQHVKDMEIELHGDLKEIPTKLETFTSTIFSHTS
ncbi:hypothetical protein Tco_0479519 [Tanacetum coccineum]